MNTRDDDGRTRLHHAALAGHGSTLRLLIDGGAEVDAVDKEREKPLCWVCWSTIHHPEVISLLREAGADPYRRAADGLDARRRAYFWYPKWGPDRMADLPPPTEPLTQADELSEAELAAGVAAVGAIVHEDREQLEAIGAYELGTDPYLWVRDAGAELDHVPQRRHPPSDESAAVDVEMWTKTDAPSDYTLQLEVETRPDGHV